MGSLEGHLIPGIFFIIYGTWWCFNSIWLYLNSNKTQNSPLAASNEIKDGPLLKYDKHASFFKCKQDLKLNKKSWIPAPFLPRIPLEPFAKIILSSLGIFVEGFLGKDKDDHIITFIYRIRKPDGTLNDLGKFYHVTLYFGFLLSGVVDLFSLCLRFPARTSTIFLSLSFLSEGLLFYFHTIGRDHFNTMAHLLLVYAIVSSFVFTLLRLYSPTSLVINLGLGNSILFQGTWLIQIGYFLFGGFLGKDEKVTHEHVMMVTACFAWHLFLISVGNLVLLTVLSITMNRCRVMRSMWKKGAKNHNGRVGWKDFHPEECSKLMTAEENEKTVDGEIEMNLLS